MNCRLCGKPLSRIRLRREGEFCSREHHDRYEFERGMSVLLEADKVAVLARRREDPIAIPLQHPAFPAALKRRRWSRTAGPLLYGDPRLPSLYVSRPAGLHLSVAGMVGTKGGLGLQASGAATPARAYQAPPMKLSARAAQAIRPGPGFRHPNLARWEQGLCAPLDRFEPAVHDCPAERRGLPARPGKSLEDAAGEARTCLGAAWLGAVEQRLTHGMGMCRIEEASGRRSLAVLKESACERQVAPGVHFRPRLPAFNGLVRSRQLHSSAAPKAVAGLQPLAPARGQVGQPGRPIECRREVRPPSIVYPSPAVIPGGIAGWRQSAPRSLILRPGNGNSRNGRRSAEAPFPSDELLFTPLRAAVQGTFAGTLEETESGNRLEENFSAGLGRWVGGTADWHLDAAGVRVGSLALLGPSVAMRDYDLEFLAKIGGRRLGWVFRAADLNNYYALTIAFEGTRNAGIVHLTRWAVVAGAQESPVVLPVRLNVGGRAAFRVQTSVKGTEFAVAVEGQTIECWSDARLQAGGVGFAAGPEDRARLYWVKVLSYD